MKILHLATQDVGGGGFDSAYRLHCNMRGAGVSSVMVVLNKKSEDADVVEISSRLSFSEKICWFLSRLLARFHRHYLFPNSYFFQNVRGFFSPEKLVTSFPFKPDAIIVHWVSTFVTTNMMRQLSLITGAPLYWYMVDMAPLTGGCHYAFDCKGYTKQCGQCPQLRFGGHKRDISHRQWQQKFNDFKDVDITAVAASSWLKYQAMESSIFSARPIKQIILGMDIDIFRPVPQMDARTELDLPENKKIIFFGAHNIHEERKGVDYLINALNRLYSMLADNLDLRRNILVVVAGSGANMDQLKIPFENRHIGFLQGDKKLSAAYQAADIFVNTSIEDSGPMMINEAILCGTPVVAFDMGVAPDLVHTGRTGYRARLRDAADMASGLRLLLEMDADSIQTMRAECRALGMRLCHPDVQVQAFMDICAPQSVSRILLHGEIVEK